MSADSLEAAGRPRVTLFVMAYNQKRLVREAIAGAFAQTWPNLEILLSDDASTDGTFAVMEEMAAAYRGPHRVRLNRNPVNLGIPRHVTRIVELAAGEFVVHGAGDDVSEPDRVARLAEVWLATGRRVRAVHSKTLGIDAEGRALGEIGPPHGILADPSPLTVIRAQGNCIGATLGFDRRLIDDFGPVPADCAVEDAALFFRAAISGGIAYVDAPLVRYRVGGLSQGGAGRPGWQSFHGERIRHFEWTLANCRSFLADMERVDFPGREACRAEALRQLDELGFRVRAARAGPAGRLALVPEALARDLGGRGGRWRLALIARYLGGEAYLRRYESKLPWWRFAPPLGHPGPLDAEARALQDRFQRHLRDLAAAELARAEVEPGHPPDVYVYRPRGETAAEAAA